MSHPQPRMLLLSLLYTSPGKKKRRLFRWLIFFFPSPALSRPAFVSTNNCARVSSPPPHHQSLGKKGAWGGEIRVKKKQVGLLPLLTLIRLALKGYSEALKGCTLPESHCVMFAETFASVCGSENSNGCFQESKATNLHQAPTLQSKIMQPEHSLGMWSRSGVQRFQGFSAEPNLNNCC